MPCVAFICVCMSVCVCVCVRSSARWNFVYQTVDVLQRENVHQHRHCHSLSLSRSLFLSFFSLLLLTQLVSGLVPVKMDHGENRFSFLASMQQMQNSDRLSEMDG